MRLNLKDAFRLERTLYCKARGWYLRQLEAFITKIIAIIDICHGPTPGSTILPHPSGHPLVSGHFSTISARIFLISFENGRYQQVLHEYVKH